MDKTNQLSLTRLAINSAFWVGLSRLFSRSFGFVRTLLLAYFLSPEDFGLFGIALLSLSILETFSTTGIKEAIIQKKDVDNNFLNTAWIINVTRGVIILLILFFMSPLIAKFFNAPESELMIKLIGFSVFISGFNNIGIVYFSKTIQFRKEFIYELGGSIADFIISIIFVILLKNAWALIIGLIIGNGVRLVLSYILHPYRPNIRFRVESAKEILNFGKWIIGGTFLVFLCSEADDIIVGRMIGVAALGAYQLAYRIPNTFSIEVSNLISIVAFPIYSKIQNNLQKLKEGFLKILRLTLLSILPLAVLVLIFISDFVTLVIGEKWSQIIWPARILLFAGIIRAISTSFVSIYLSKGKPNISFKRNFIRFLFTFLFIYPLTQYYGIIGTSISVVIGLVVMFIFDILFLSKKSILDISKTLLIKELLIFSIPSLALFLILFLLKMIITIKLSNFIIQIILSPIIYLSIIYFFVKIIKTNPFKEIINNYISYTKK